MGDGALNRRAVFLDRDGVLNEAVVRAGKPHPPGDVASMKIVAGVREALERLAAAGFSRIVITNQPDVGRGAQRRETVEAIHAELQRCLPLDAVYVCYHAGDEACECRKPRPGLIFQAAREHGIDLARSFMIGDRWKDVAAATAAGVRPVFIDYGYAEPKPAEPHDTARSVDEAAELILQRK